MKIHKQKMGKFGVHVRPNGNLELIVSAGAIQCR